MLKLIQHIREEFGESPGLRATIDEGAVLGLDAEVCELVLSEGQKARQRSNAKSRDAGSKVRPTAGSVTRYPVTRGSPSG